MMFGGYDYERYDDYSDFDDFYKVDVSDEWLDAESFLDHYKDEIEDRVIYALDPMGAAAVQLTFFGGAY